MSNDTVYLIVENYPNGDTWRHFFHDADTAKWNLESLQAAHPSRTYDYSEVRNAR